MILSPTGLLNDKIVDAVNTLVRLHVGTDVNQSTLLSQVPTGFQPLNPEAIQILHDNEHWVTSACINNEVMLADSLGSRAISIYVTVQLRQLYARLIDPTSNRLPVAIVPSPRQGNGADCGVYAAATAFEWAVGNQDLPHHWDVASMRPHLAACLERSALERFPLGKAQRGRRGRPVKVWV